MPGSLLEGRIVGEPLAGLGVEALQIAERLAVLARVVEMGDKTTEIRTPVADVVLPDDVVAQGFQHPRHGVADDRAAQVVNLHLLGKIGVGVVDDHAAATAHRVEATSAQCLRQVFVGDREADEARAGDFATFRNPREIGSLHDPLREFPGRRG